VVWGSCGWWNWFLTRLLCCLKMRKRTYDSVGGEGSSWRFSRKKRYLNVLLGKLDYKLSFFFTMGIYSFCGLNVFPKY
jgi:hypothetical protein